MTDMHGDEFTENMISTYKKEGNGVVCRKKKKVVAEQKMKRLLVSTTLVIAACSGCQRTWLNLDLSASSMRKWLDSLITRLGVAEYWETEAAGREVQVPF